MSIFDALSGKILHFNKNVIPISNNFIERAKEIKDEDTKLFLILLCKFAYEGVEIIFNPKNGWLWDKVKKYHYEDFEKLFATLFLWEAPVIIFEVLPKEEFFKKVKYVANLKDQEFEKLIFKAENENKFGNDYNFIAGRAEKLFKILSDILRIDELELGNYFTFMDRWAKLKKQIMDNATNK